MVATISVDTFKAQVFELFTETFDTVQGIYLDKGTSLFETLDTIGAAEASTPLSASCATIAAQVEHVAFYLDVIGQYARGEDPGPVDWAASWTLGAVTAEEWAALKTRLREAQARARTTLEAMEGFDDPDRVGEAISVVVHTAYHLGEIRQALCAIRGSAS